MGPDQPEVLQADATAPGQTENCEIKISVHGIKEVPKSGTNQEILDYHGYNYENLKKMLI